jgi:hypothetical protein
MEPLVLVVLVYLLILIILLLDGNHGLVLRIFRINVVMVISVIIVLILAFLLVLPVVVFLFSNVNLFAFLQPMNVILQLINVTKSPLVMVLIYLIAKDNVLQPRPQVLAPLDKPLDIRLLDLLDLLEIPLNNKDTLAILFL